MNLHYHSCSVSTKWNPYFFSRSVLGTQFAPKSQNNCRILFSGKFLKNCIRKSAGQAVIATMAALSSINRDFGENNDGKTAKGSGTTARGRRLLMVREDKRKREYDKLQNYPALAKVLEVSWKNDSELRAVLGDSIGNPELMRKNVEERVQRKGRVSSNGRMVV